MADPEVQAISEITKALDSLNELQRSNVLAYVKTRYRESVPTSVTRQEAVPQILESTSGGNYSSLGELFDAASPDTEADRVLVVAYWAQVIEGVTEFEAFPINRHLKDLGHSVSNITRALDSLIQNQPRLVIQVSKTGSSKQARKKYKLTREGVKRCQQMLSGGKDGE